MSQHSDNQVRGGSARGAARGGSWRQRGPANSQPPPVRLAHAATFRPTRLQINADEYASRVIAKNGDVIDGNEFNKLVSPDGGALTPDALAELAEMRGKGAEPAQLAAAVYASKLQRELLQEAVRAQLAAIKVRRGVGAPASNSTREPPPRGPSPHALPSPAVPPPPFPRPTRRRRTLTHSGRRWRRASWSTWGARPSTPTRRTGPPTVRRSRWATRTSATRRCARARRRPRRR
jgi:hypothetical protein